MRALRLSTSILIPLLFVGTSALGQDVQLPGGAAAWLNSAPISARMLKGKAAVLYYFEES